MAGIRIDLSPPEALSRFRDLAKTMLEPAGKVTPKLRATLKKKARELGVHHADFELIATELQIPEAPAQRQKPATQPRKKTVPGTLIDDDRKETIYSGHDIFQDRAPQEVRTMETLQPLPPLEPAIVNNNPKFKQTPTWFKRTPKWLFGLAGAIGAASILFVFSVIGGSQSDQPTQPQRSEMNASVGAAAEQGSHLSAVQPQQPKSIPSQQTAADSTDPIAPAVSGIKPHAKPDAAIVQKPKPDESSFGDGAAPSDTDSIKPSAKPDAVIVRKPKPDDSSFGDGSAPDDTGIIKPSGPANTEVHPPKPKPEDKSFGSGANAPTIGIKPSGKLP